MYILPFIALIIVVGFIFHITKPKKKKADVKLDIRAIRIGDSIYYYDRWWEVTEVRSGGTVSGKDKDGNVSANIAFDEITDYKPYDNGSN